MRRFNIKSLLHSVAAPGAAFLAQPAQNCALSPAEAFCDPNNPKGSTRISQDSAELSNHPSSSIFWVEKSLNWLVSLGF